MKIGAVSLAISEEQYQQWTKQQDVFKREVATYWALDGQS